MLCVPCKQCAHRRSRIVLADEQRRRAALARHEEGDRWRFAQVANIHLLRALHWLQPCAAAYYHTGEPSTSGTSSPLRCTARFWHASAVGLFLKIWGGTLPSRSLERAGSLAGRGSRTLGVNVEELLELHDEKKIIQKADVTGFAKSCGLSRQQTNALLNPPVLLASGLLPPFRLQEPARQRDYADRRWPHLVAHRHTRRGEATGPCGGGACDFKRAQAARQRRPQRLRRLVTTTFA